MNITTSSHPAVRLGAWLKAARRAKGLVKRAFAEAIHLTPAKYTEVEAGVISWLDEKREEAITTVLQLAGEALREFESKLNAARAVARLTFSDIFTRDQLMPLRSRLHSDRAIQEMERTLILDAVFAPLT
jgi:transcriptional regulator with XRE-family HTH domain